MISELQNFKCPQLNKHLLMRTLITTDTWNWVVCPKFFTFGQSIYKHILLAHLCIIPYILWMPSSPLQNRREKNFRKQFRCEDRSQKILSLRRGVTFLGKGLKYLPRKWKLYNLNYIHITLNLRKIYAQTHIKKICNFTIYTNVLNGFSEEKKLLGWEILFWWYFCNLKYLAYLLYALHYSP